MGIVVLVRNTPLLFAFGLLTISVILISVRYDMTRYAYHANFPVDMGAISDVENYKTLYHISDDLKNYYFFMRAIANKTQYVDQRGTAEDGYISMSSSLEKLIDLSKEKRRQELNKIARLIRNKIERLQNLSVCNSGPSILLDINNEMKCGFGCILHSVIISMIEAYVTNQSFVIESKGWHYAPEGFEYIFLPLSNCTINDTSSSTNSIATDLRHKVPWRVPLEFGDRLTKIHSHPFAWWVSQFTSYIFRFQPWFQEDLDKRAKLIGFTESAVGVHIRWGDKLDKEAEKFPLESYMEFVERWYKRQEYEGKKVERTIYLATEDILARKLLIQRFPQYHIITSQLWTKRVTHQRQRYNHNGLESIATDIYFLSRCNYLICTLSSSVCRTAYELFVSRHADASSRFQSLDTMLHLKTLKRRPWTAIADHNPATDSEIALQKGDEIKTYLNHHQAYNQGFLQGENLRTKEVGLFPVFKAREQVLTFNFSSKV